MIMGWLLDILLFLVIYFFNPLLECLLSLLSRRRL